VIFQQISHGTALQWIKNNESLKGTIHEDFHKWILHLSESKLKYFLKGNHYWSAAFDRSIIGIYYYTIYDDKMYDGYLISDRPTVGLKLDRYQRQYTKARYNWKINWTMCNTKHLKYNLRLGYKIASKKIDDYYYMYRK